MKRCAEAVKKTLLDTFMQEGSAPAQFYAFNESPYMMAFPPMLPKDKFVEQLRTFCREKGVLLLVFVFEDTVECTDPDAPQKEFDALVMYIESGLQRQASFWPILRREPEPCVGHEVAFDRDQLDEILPTVLSRIVTDPLTN